MVLLCDVCITLRIPLIQSQQFTDEFATRLQAAPAAQQQLGDALERCALMAAAACFAQAHAGGGSAGSSGGSGGVAPAPAGASPASEQSAPAAQARAQTYAEDAVAAVLEARWSPALLPPWPAAACSSASLARAPRLLDLISRMLAALPAKLPAAGARRGAFLTALVTTCCFAGEAVHRCVESDDARRAAAAISVVGGLDPRSVDVLQPVAHAAVRLLPQLAAAWRLLADTEAEVLRSAAQAVERTAQLPIVVAGSGLLTVSSLTSCCMLAMLATNLSTPGQLADWSSAAGNMLRSVPALMRLAERSGEAVLAPLPSLPYAFLQTAGLVAAAMGEHGLHPGCGGCRSCAAAAERAPLHLTAAQGRCLQVLHSTACRAVHLLQAVRAGMPAATPAAITVQPHTAVAAAFNVLLAARAAASAGQSQAERQEPPLSR